MNTAIFMCEPDQEKNNELHYYRGSKQFDKNNKYNNRTKRGGSNNGHWGKNEVNISISHLL